MEKTIAIDAERPLPYLKKLDSSWQFIVDFISPSIYPNNYASICAEYWDRDQPLFIPDQRRDEYGGWRIWKAFGSYQAIGSSPFGIDTLEAKTCPFTKHYQLLSSVSQIILKHIVQI